MAKNKNNLLKKIGKPFRKAWEKLGPNGRAGLAFIAFCGVTVVPFPTVPITMTLAAVVLRNSTYSQRIVARLRQKYPERAQKICDKFLNSKACPSVLKSLIRETDPKLFFANKDKAVSNSQSKTSSARKAQKTYAILQNKRKTMEAKSAPVDAKPHAAGNGNIDATTIASIKAKSASKN